MFREAEVSISTLERKKKGGVYAAERCKHFWSRCYVSGETWEKGKKSCGVSFNSRECTALTRPMSTVLGSCTHTSGNVQHGETGTPHLTRTERAVRPATYKPKGQKLLVRVRKKHQGLSKSTTSTAGNILMLLKTHTWLQKSCEKTHKVHGGVTFNQQFGSSPATRSDYSLCSDTLVWTCIAESPSVVDTTALNSASRRV